jgi:hypothetical protein
LGKRPYFSVGTKHGIRWDSGMASVHFETFITSRK